MQYIKLTALMSAVARLMLNVGGPVTVKQHISQTVAVP